MYFTGLFHCFFKRINKICLGFALLVGLNYPAFAQNFGSKNSKVSFFSSTPVEDIKAVSNSLTSIVITKTQEIAFQVPIKSFQFAKGLMQEHFNENYMESDKYPYAKFKGTIQQPIDTSKDGEYTVTASGVLTVHGISKQRTIPGKIFVQKGKMRLISSFDVACADHNIKIPTIIIRKVAEIIKVNVDATLSPLNP